HYHLVIVYLAQLQYLYLSMHQAQLQHLYLPMHQDQMPTDRMLPIAAWHDEMKLSFETLRAASSG
ncbi:hypothetical protein CCACVL1_11832, partial [Corchorus capsularis]